MKKPADRDAPVEVLDLERFVRVVRGLPKVPKSEIDKIIAEGKAKSASKPILERCK
jgi:hypothetical protein